MLDELVAVVVPGGAWLAAGVAVGSAFGDRLRPAAKMAVKVSMGVADRLQEIGMETAERAQDFVAEARDEHQKARPAAASRSGGRTRRKAVAATPET